MSSKEELTKPWENAANDVLAGGVIESVRYLTDDQQRALGWDNKSAVLRVRVKGKLVLAYASTDDEGNGPGALFIDREEGSLTIPVI